MGMGRIFKFLAIIPLALLINAAFFLAVPIINALFFSKEYVKEEKEKTAPREVELLVKEPKKEIQQRTIRDVPQSSNQFKPNQAQGSLNKGIKGFSMDLSLAGVGESGVSIGSGGMENMVYNVEEVEVEARVLKEVFPQYPEHAIRRKIVGFARVNMVIDMSGNVTEAFVSLVDPPGFGFETAALTAIRQFKFSPALVGGVPVKQRLIKDFNFKFLP
ncbi:MAG: TonB family protein [Fibromonadales bacterium]|nr:TonB family protein [Fibromonadales bacterium]